MKRNKQRCENETKVVGKSANFYLSRCAKWFKSIPETKMKHLVTLSIFLTLSLYSFAWTSSNEGICYTMEMLCELSDSITFIHNDTAKYYEVKDDIIILENDTLRLVAGEELLFLDMIRRMSVIIYGCLLAEGTINRPIILGDKNANFWEANIYNGIKFYNNIKESKLIYCNIIAAQNKYLEEYESAIYCINSSPLIDHCSISYM